MKKVFLYSTLLLLLASADARTWTDTKGRTVEAEVVRVNPDRTVKLKNGRGKTFTVPFDTFSEQDVRYLETLLTQPADLHPVPWEKMNELMGFPLWSDSNLWDDPSSEVARRTKLGKESGTDYLENYRSYPLGNSMLFGEAVYAAALYGGKTRTDSLSLVFLNQGDIPKSSDPREVKEQIEASGKRILAAIEPILGKPERDSLGKDDLREKVWRWDWNGHAIMLSLQEGKYTAVRIMPTERADHAGRAGKIKDKELKARLASCVERRDNGDVVIRNIPMINQGPKGYCVPATWERYLRYMDIPVDMYLLALAANTGVGGGTYTKEINDATSNILHSYGRKLSRCGEKPNLKTVAQQIDKGLPILWTLRSTPSFQNEANDNTARRNGKEVKPRKSGQTEDTTAGGHMCLIIGYNKKTGEIAISDSWGPRFTERWISQEEAEKVSGTIEDSSSGILTIFQGELYIIKW